LTKYGLVFHIACVCLFPLVFLCQPRVAGLVPLFWLSLAALEWMVLLPSIRRGETLMDARQRVAHAFGWDPLLYIGGAIIVFVGAQCLNSGCELVYLPDVDVWQMSQPPVSWAPYSVERGAALTQLAVFTGAVTVALALRAAVGKASKRALMQALAMISGGLAWVCSGVAFHGGELCAALASGPGASAVGTYFGFWLLLSMGLFAEALGREQRGCVWLFLIGCFGNLLGMLCFASPLVLMVYTVVAVLFVFYWLAYLSPIVSKTTQLKLFLCTVFCVAAVVVGLVFLYPRSPVAEKLKTVWPVTEHWDTFSARNAVRAKAALAVWQEHPWTGVGSDGFNHFVGLAVAPGEWRAVEEDRAYVFNDGLQFLCEYGVFGAGLLFAGVIALLGSVCSRMRSAGQHKTPDQNTERSFLFRLSPIVVSGALAALLCCLESFIASPFRSVALLLAWVCVMASMPAFFSEKA
jgi:hypothetical protein